MFGKAVRGLGIFAVLVVAAGFSLTLFIENATGDFLQILKLGKAGVKIAVAGFIPLGLLLLYKSR